MDYGCFEDPFRAGIDGRFIYLGTDPQDRFDRLLRSVETQEGLSLITGPAGSGKTALLRKLVSDLRASDPLIFFFATPIQTLETLLDGCREQAGLTGEDNGDGAEPMLAVREFLSRFNPERSRLLLIDEAQSLPDEILWDLLALAEPDVHGKSLLPIVLAGECSIVQRLTDEPFCRRAHSIGYRYEVTPLVKPEVAALIRHRLSVAGCSDTNPFSHDVVERMADYANGVPGTINTLCRLALFFASEGEETHVTVSSVELAASAALLNKEPLRVSRMGSAKHSQSERGDDNSEAAATRGGTAAVPVPAGDLLTPDSDLDGLAPLPDPNGEPGVVEGSSRGALAIVDADPIQTPPRGPARIWLPTAIPAILALGALMLLYSELRQSNFPIAAPNATLEDARHTTKGRESEESATNSRAQVEVTADVTAKEASSAAAATASPYPSAIPAAVVSENQTASKTLASIQLEVTAVADSEISQLLLSAEEHIRADRLIAPRFNNALAVYRKILRASPENQAALNGLAAIKAKLMSYAKAEAERGDTASARRQLKKIESIDKEWGTARNRSNEVAGGLDGLRQSFRPFFLSDR